MKKTGLRSGYTTGACAAAAAKAAVLLVARHVSRITKVEIPFPDGSRVTFKVQRAEFKGASAKASVIKDAGDDPDVTNGAEIVAEVKVQDAERMKHNADEIIIKGGQGVGIITKPGLSVSVGEPAINPVPREMIRQAVNEAVSVETCNSKRSPLRIEVTISVPKGEELAKKTLNHRLGIAGGISILGTTGIVKPVSAEAWTATITSSMDVAKAMGYSEIVISAGRTSEKAHMKEYGLPEESYVLMGDYLEYSLKEAEKHKFKKIHLNAQWAKMVKIAMATPQTHVRFGAIDVGKAVALLNSLGFDVPKNREFNTAREIFDYIVAGNTGTIHAVPLQKICDAAKQYAEGIIGGSPVTTYLISYDGKVISASE